MSKPSNRTIGVFPIKQREEGVTPFAWPSVMVPSPTFSSFGRIARSRPLLARGLWHLERTLLLELSSVSRVRHAEGNRTDNGAPFARLGAGQIEAVGDVEDPAGIRSVSNHDPGQMILSQYFVCFFLVLATEPAAIQRGNSTIARAWNRPQRPAKLLLA